MDSVSVILMVVEKQQGTSLAVLSAALLDKSLNGGHLLLVLAVPRHHLRLVEVLDNLGQRLALSFWHQRVGVRPRAKENVEALAAERNVVRLEKVLLY